MKNNIVFFYISQFITSQRLRYLVFFFWVENVPLEKPHTLIHHAKHILLGLVIMSVFFCALLYWPLNLKGLSFSSHRCSDLTIIYCTLIG